MVSFWEGLSGPFDWADNKCPMDPSVAMVVVSLGKYLFLMQARIAHSNDIFFQRSQRSFHSMEFETSLRQRDDICK